ncbi:hypothetical protein BLA55_03945 [Mycoplasmopsis pullorum]|uniref:Uncharacterized protein n=2 Tax=Mycoplasmopsis pullorum TaxID=48003 RepID=A0A1L4FR67_9BACT|nr:hypothetical protein BLA55_00120 [Mycoplasmopsis pullorum]APJ38765.1 hypothetical protein BLA55_03840 [Mycoplasmopsis pullorum]APJ38782.1 hypothetical protein BLA55_03945 [Mycoplasmopsis pullorum]
MLCLNIRKLHLAKWIYTNKPKLFDNTIKFNFFLFLYELYSKIEYDVCDFKYLVLYKRYPIFMNVLHDLKKEKTQLIKLLQSEEFKNTSYAINKNRAILCAFLATVLTRKEIQNFIYNFNIIRKRYIDENLKIHINEKDLDHSDILLLQWLKDYYPVEFIKKTKICHLGNNYVLIPEQKFEEISLEQIFDFRNILYSLNLANPVECDLQDGSLVIVTKRK